MFSFSSKSFGEWKLVAGNFNKGIGLYVDFKRINKKNDYTYFWYLMDFREKKYMAPEKRQKGFHSFVIFSQGDCDLFRFKDVQFNVYKSRMGEDYLLGFKPQNKWKYPTPGSNYESVLKSVCK